MMKCVKGFEIKALKANMAYIGTVDEQGFPNCRCSDYFKNKEQAQNALNDNTFKVRQCAENVYCSGIDGCRIKMTK